MAEVPDSIEVGRQTKEISNDLQQQEGLISSLLEKNKGMTRALNQEINNIEATLLRCENAVDHVIDPSVYLRDTGMKVRAIRNDLWQQEHLIKRLIQLCEESRGRVETHAARLLPVIERQAGVIRTLESEISDQKMTISDLNLKKCQAEHGILQKTREAECQSRVAASVEAKINKLKEILNCTAHLMLLELETQDELINDLPTNTKFRTKLSKSRKEMNDMAEKVHRLTSDDNELPFDLELEPNLRKEIADLRDKVGFQNLQIDYQARQISEQAKTIKELEVEKRILALSLEDANLEVMNLMDKPSPSDQSGKGGGGIN